MKFSIEQQELKRVLSAVQGVTDKKATIPVLQNLLIESNEGRTGLTVHASNLDMAISKQAAATIGTAGTICISARKLSEIVNTLPNAEVSFESEANHWVKMACGRSTFRLAGRPKDDFPSIPQPPSLPITIDSVLLADMISKTAFAITNESSRFTLSGAKFLVHDGKVAMITTDGHRLSYVERHPSEEQPSLEGSTIDVMIPKFALVEASKITSDDHSIRIGADQNHVFFESQGQLLSARKLSGQFPNYEMVLPKPGDNDKVATVDGDDLKSAVRRVSLMADERLRSMKVTVAAAEIRLDAAAQEQGEGSEVVEAEYGGDELVLAYNYHYLLDFLNLVKGEEKVVVMIKDANAQTELRLAGDDGFRHIIMPLRV